ncbi:MAG: sigma-54-dependent Fis family transcriptional regulator [Nitrospirae bacterium]|nr:MAG: sigma-54-dependent Fis family transcriptional regulator [Nitrospirota bacterium]
MAETILIVEDDPHVLLSYQEILKPSGYEVVTVDSGEAAERILRTSSIDVVITDRKMPKMGGLEVLRIAKQVDPEIIVILITAYPTVDTAVEAMKFGACDYLIKPFSVEQLRAVVKEALEKRKTKEAYGLLQSQRRSAFTVGGIVGQSRGLLKLLDEIRKVAAVSANVLILGESGVGKEPVARAIHENSARQGQPFVPLNCAAIPETLLEAELFGYERGAFTEAQSAKEGLLEAADGGTLFLDEFCELSPALQAKLLRTLEEGAVRRLGGRKPIPFDVRFVASTNRDIREEIRLGRFRQDLFFRINVLEIRVPPLRERREDIPLLVAHFLEEGSKGSGKAIEGITPEAMEWLTQYDWPGNVRELKNAVGRALAYATGPFITVQDLPEAILMATERQGRFSSYREWREKILERLEKEFLEKSIHEQGGNLTLAAKELGIHRSTLHRLIRKHHLLSP